MLWTLMCVQSVRAGKKQSRSANNQASGRESIATGGSIDFITRCRNRFRNVEITLVRSCFATFAPEPVRANDSIGFVVAGTDDVAGTN
jgi:hypothetical protein